ncbi:response regulator transcription factor [Chamaesiphon sp. VAR_48_metabat_135_sub]|uniref:response regulator transcription factor n=1 Tax=Chamaesiphon sp. VAR_48_metabat_135_sub TaxID=2964699 RepID=UPI00286C0365|nr:response regulator transcription factor [Chamaesiphon sp. VAR_48_metabat_135_sub]
MSNLLKILLVEDDELFRLGLLTCLQQESSVELVVEAADGETGFDLARQQAFDIVILDLVLPGWDGIETCRQFQQFYPNLPVLILTSHPEKNLVLTLIEAGAKGYCQKGIDAEKLVLAIRSISTGATWWDPNASYQIYAAINQVEQLSSVVDELQLTKRELEVLTLIAQGRTNQQIAQMLFITAGTVRVHVHAILKKLNVRDRTQAAIFALQQNLIA